MEIKLGQWYKDSCGYLAQVVSIMQFLDKETQYNLRFSNRTVPIYLSSFSNFTYVPNCTGYGWKPLQVPDGYRLLEVGEVPVAGDLWSINGIVSFEPLSSGSYMVYQKNPIPPMSERVAGATGFGTYDPGSMWARKVEKWVPYTFENCPAIIKVVNKASKLKYAAYLRDEKYVNLAGGYYTFKELFDQYTDINGGPLGTTE
jgi:hypothetical protein